MTWTSSWAEFTSVCVCVLLTGDPLKPWRCCRVSSGSTACSSPLIRGRWSWERLPWQCVWCPWTLSLPMTRSMAGTISIPRYRRYIQPVYSETALGDLCLFLFAFYIYTQGLRLGSCLNGFITYWSLAQVAKFAVNCSIGNHDLYRSLTYKLYYIKTNINMQIFLLRIFRKL